MSNTLVVTTAIMDQLREAVGQSDESAAVLLASLVATEEGTRLLARELWWVPRSGYLRRSPTGLTVGSDGYVPALARAEDLGAVALWLHTHPFPGASPAPSDHDLRVNETLAETFRIRSGSPYYGWAIFAPDGDTVSFSGQLQGVGRVTQLDRLWEVGDRWALTQASGSPAEPVPSIFDRNIRAFGGDVQRVLSELRVGIVGCGGTGSAVAEQLVRLGVRNLTLVDPKKLSDSNLTRVYGSRPEHVGRAKAQVLRDHLKSVAPEAQVQVIVGTVTRASTARRLAGTDLIFGCTDDNAGRVVLSRLSSYLLTPVVDCGVLLSSDTSGRLVGIDGRVTTLGPGSACLICRDRIDLAMAASESLSEGERDRRVAEGYAPGLPGVEPAVITYTTSVAAAAVGELLERLIGYGPEPRPSEVLLRAHEREISINQAAPRSGHYCDPNKGILGRGVSDPFLDMAWAG